MSKYLGLVLLATILLLSGFIYQSYYRPKNVGSVKSSERLVEINMRILQDKWKWQLDTVKISHKGKEEHLQTLSPIREQATIQVRRGDKVKLHIYNEDTYDHGFAVDVFGVNKRLFPKTTTVVEFTPALTGKFNFYCSVPCGEGHYDQIGTLIVGDEHAVTGFIPNKNFACNIANVGGVLSRVSLPTVLVKSIPSE